MEKTEVLNNEPTADEQTGSETQELSAKEKQARAYQELQSQNDKLKNELHKMELERVRLEERTRLQTEQREVTPQRPKLPVKPKNFSMLDAASDENSPSSIYMKEVLEYNEAKAVYDNWFESGIEAERNARLQAEQRARQDKDLIAGFTQYATPDEATKAAEWFKKTIETGDYEGVIKAYRGLTNQPVKDKQTMDSIPLPPGVLPNQTGKTEMTHAQSMREWLKSHNI